MDCIKCCICCSLSFSFKFDPYFPFVSDCDNEHVTIEIKIEQNLFQNSFYQTMD